MRQTTILNHTAWIWIWMTKSPGVTSDGNFSSYLIKRSGYGRLFICFYPPFFQKLADRLDWLCPVGSTLHFRPLKMTRNGCISFYQSSMNSSYHQKLHLVFCHSDPDSRSVEIFNSKIKSSDWLFGTFFWSQIVKTFWD
jgi:hypothetical protein